MGDTVFEVGKDETIPGRCFTPPLEAEGVPFHHIEVYVDGERVRRVYLIDMERGYVGCYDEDADGSPYVHRDGPNARFVRDEAGNLYQANGRVARTARVGRVELRRRVPLPPAPRVVDLAEDCLVPGEYLTPPVPGRRYHFTQVQPYLDGTAVRGVVYADLNEGLLRVRARGQDGSYQIVENTTGREIMLNEVRGRVELRLRATA